MSVTTQKKTKTHTRKNQTRSSENITIASIDLPLTLFSMLHKVAVEAWLRFKVSSDSFEMTNGVGNGQTTLHSRLHRAGEFPPA